AGLDGDDLMGHQAAAAERAHEHGTCRAVVADHGPDRFRGAGHGGRHLQRDAALAHPRPRPAPLPPPPPSHPPGHTPPPPPRGGSQSAPTPAPELYPAPPPCDLPTTPGPRRSIGCPSGFRART